MVKWTTNTRIYNKPKISCLWALEKDEDTNLVVFCDSCGNEDLIYKKNIVRLINHVVKAYLESKGEK